jgi:dTDP-4-dehydrorhamnose 3,5-epimerase
VSLIRTINLPVFGDARGKLIAIEINDLLPFIPQRIYYIFDTKFGVSRGFHAHRNLQQVAVAIAGKCRIVLDDGIRREEVWLESPEKGLIINKMIWREMHDFSSDCILIVFASEKYMEEDYIRSYNQFLEQKF